MLLHIFFVLAVGLLHLYENCFVLCFGEQLWGSSVSDLFNPTVSVLRHHLRTTNDSHAFVTHEKEKNSEKMSRNSFSAGSHQTEAVQRTYCTVPVHTVRYGTVRVQFDRLIGRASSAVITRKPTVPVPHPNRYGTHDITVLSLERREHQCTLLYCIQYFFKKTDDWTKKVSRK